MGTPGTTHMLTALHFHPNALTELIEEHRAMISALHILAHAVGGEMWPKLVHSGALAAAEYGRDEIYRLRAENERLITLVADIRRHVSECPDGVGRFIHERMQDFEQRPNA